MEAVSTITTPFQREEFGDLVSLPDRVKSWKVEADDLKAKAERFNGTLTAMDLTAMDPAALDALDERLTKSIQVISGSFSKIEGQRKAATAILDEIKAFTMLPEKSIATWPGTFKGYRDKIAAEKAARSRKADAARAADIARKQEAIDLRTKQRQLIRGNFDKYLIAAFNALSRKFYEQTLDSIDAYGATLQKWSPEMKQERWAEIQKNGDVPCKWLTIDEVSEIYKTVAAEWETPLSKEWTSTLSTERDRLIELIPSRKRELEEIAKGNESAATAAIARQEQEEADRLAALEQQQTDQHEALAAMAEIEKVDAVYDAESTATVTSLAKGTVVQKKYKPTTPAAWLPIIQSWIKNDLNLCTLEEIEKKIKFMLTSANGRLNKGERLEGKGLEVVEDYSTRTSRKKELPNA